jgi:hypothetical protein
VTTDRLDAVIQEIDRANARDPRSVDDGGTQRPAELVYGERMSRALQSFCPGASDHLRIAIRAQHIERWTSPRDSYPEGRVGYLKWRKDLKDFHARRAAELMREAGYGGDDIDRVASLIRKERLKLDAEAQTLEDVACLVFLERYAAEFIADHADDKVVDILAKTARKMSADGLAAAARLPLQDRLARLLGQALADRKAATEG